MKRNLFKEVIIALLLCLLIMLVFALVLYQFVPNNKTMPPQVSYTTPKEISEELVSNSGLNDDEIIMTYEIDSDDIQNYERINEYNPGKANPFQVLDSTDETTNSGGTSSNSGGSADSGSTGEANSSSSNSNSQSSSGASSGTGSTSSSSEFYNDHGSGK